MRNDIFQSALRVGRNQTDRCRRRSIDRVRKWNLAGFQPLLVNNVFFGGENKPNWLYTQDFR